MERIGDRVWSAAPINEPWCVGWMCHFLGHHAPGLRDIRATARAMHHVLLAHGRADRGDARPGHVRISARSATSNTPCPPTTAPRPARPRATYDGYYNRFFLGGLINRAYPDDVLEGLARTCPPNWQDDMALIGQQLDWLGLNYYTRKIIAPASGPWPALEEVPGPLPKTQLGWEIYPEGLHAFLTRVHEGYTRGLPLYVTENGMAWDDRVTDGAVDDRRRIDYLNAHLAQVRRAIDDGVPVQGYFTWSLLDNYEWNVGYGPRFGLVHVDYASQTRTPKACYHALRARRWPMTRRCLVSDVGGTNTRVASGRGRAASTRRASRASATPSTPGSAPSMRAISPRGGGRSAPAPASPWPAR